MGVTLVAAGRVARVWRRQYVNKAQQTPMEAPLGAMQAVLPEGGRPPARLRAPAPGGTPVNAAAATKAQGSISDEVLPHRFASKIANRMVDCIQAESRLPPSGAMLQATQVRR